MTEAGGAPLTPSLRAKVADGVVPAGDSSLSSDGPKGPARAAHPLAVAFSAANGLRSLVFLPGLPSNTKMTTNT